jgi:hypothetical protein
MLYITLLSLYSLSWTVMGCFFKCDYTDMDFHIFVTCMLIVKHYIVTLHKAYVIDSKVFIYNQTISNNHDVSQSQSISYNRYLSFHTACIYGFVVRAMGTYILFCCSSYGNLIYTVLLFQLWELKKYCFVVSAI